MPYGNPPDCRPKHRLSSVWLKFSPAFFKRRRGRGRGALSRKAPKVPEILLRKSFRLQTAKYSFRRLFWANSAKQICGGATRSLYFFLCALFLQRKSGYGICTLFISTAFCRQPTGETIGCLPRHKIPESAFHRNRAHVGKSICFFRSGY